MWRRHFPGSPEPPVWITLQLRPGPQDETPEQFTLATFRTGDGHELFSPQTCQVTDADVAALTGMTVIRQARREGTAGWALSSRVAELVAAQNLPAQEKEALGELLAERTAIQRRRPCYGNGRHRITAMFDSGVRRTAVLRWQYPG